MELLEFAEVLQPLHHCDPVPTQIPAQQQNCKRSDTKKIIGRPFEIDACSARHSQFGELLQVGQVLDVSDGVVLQEQMGEVGGKAQVADV